MSETALGVSPDPTPDPTPDRSPPVPGRSEDWSGDALPQAVGLRPVRLSIVWLIPLVALASGGWLAYKTFADEGPTIQIEFNSAAGLQPSKTKVKFKDVALGEVTAIDVSPDLKSVLVTAQLKYGSAPYLTKHTRFWVERARVTASRVSGLDTLLSGPYIAIDPVIEGESERRFRGLDEPPLFTTSEPGKRFVLRAPALGSLNLGSPVYYRQIEVGQVVGYELAADGQAVSIELFISAPHDRLVQTNTRFWNASGVDVAISTAGVRVDAQSLLSVLIGGVSFDTPETIDEEGKPARSQEVFPLYPSRTEAHAKTYAYKEQYLLYFKGSVNGLTVGAQVMLRGIAIGRVLDVQLTFNVEDLEFQIPVLVEVEPGRIGVRGAPAQGGRIKVIERLVANGLRGQLKSSNLLTGELYVDLDFYPKAAPEPLGRHGDYLVLPTVPTSMEALTTRANSILDKLDGLPIEQIGRDVAAAAASAKTIVGSPELKGAIAETAAALAALRQTAERLNGEIAPELAAALRATTATMKDASDVVAENSPIYIESQKMFQELTAAARSLRLLADYLERHPEALLKGKAGGR
ncbi:MlaD family protein [uncultured Thiodictyon sp.]|uniref:PqiB family protein n=1 Tax=uncultured Thiodictyon sp. TaxID=1846217 RepID=UPI0025F8C62D|nr:MlaD family protein [uncultured Thiodictyon sp.]